MRARVFSALAAGTVVVLAITVAGVSFAAITSNRCRTESSYALLRLIGCGAVRHPHAGAGVALLCDAVLMLIVTGLWARWLVARSRDNSAAQQVRRPSGGAA